MSSTIVYLIKKPNDPDRVQPVVGIIKKAVLKLNDVYTFQKTYINHDEQFFNSNPPDETKMFIAIGGDGTMLDALKKSTQIDDVKGVIGINLGKVGFLTDFTVDDTLEQTLFDILGGGSKYKIEERIALCTETKWNNSIAFNEFSISSEFSDTMIEYTLKINNHYAGIHRANSIIVGTPTGSTAYTLSAGGGLLLPTMEAMQIVPVAPFSLTSRPIITNSKDIVSIEVESQGNIVIRADGHIIGGAYKSTRVAITQTQYKGKIVHSEDWNYFDMLTQKLGWKSI